MRAYSDILPTVLAINTGNTMILFISGDAAVCRGRPGKKVLIVVVQFGL